MQQLLILQIILIFLWLLTPIFSYFDPQRALQSDNTYQSSVQCYILSLYTYLCQIGEMEMDKLSYFTIFKVFRYFWDFLTILRYFDTQIAVQSHNTTQSGVQYYILSLYTYLRWNNFPYFTNFKGFLIFLGLFTSISSYFNPQIALKSQNTPNSGG